MSKKIAVIPGDGTGPELINEGVKVLRAAEDSTKNLSLDLEEFPFGADHYLETDELVTEEDLERIGKNDAIYLGALGDPRVEAGVLEKGILLKIRFYFDQYINLRPIKLYPNVSCPLAGKGPEDIDFYVVRENTEDFYAGIGGRLNEGKNEQELTLSRSLYESKFDLDVDVEGDELAYQIGVVSKKGTERAVRFAFELAEDKGHERVTSVDKANVLSDCYGLWREVFEEVSEDYPGMETEFSYVDAINMWLVKQPEYYQTIVTPNMFGDIITDLGAMIQGGLGLAPGGNINPNGVSMFEPIHGSAPKHAGKNKADPIATILAGKMMLNQLGEEKAADKIEKAVEEVLREGEVRTYDLNGDSTTSEVGDAVAEKVREI